MYNAIKPWWRAAIAKHHNNIITTFYITLLKYTLNSTCYLIDKNYIIACIQSSSVISNDWSYTQIPKYVLKMKFANAMHTSVRYTVFQIMCNIAKLHVKFNM